MDLATGARNRIPVAQLIRRTLQEIEPGMRFSAGSDQGNQIVTVVKVDDEIVTVDGNHPLAGETLYFDVDVVDLREASEEEANHGHVHGPDGHDL